MLRYQAGINRRYGTAGFRPRLSGVTLRLPFELRLSRGLLLWGSLLLLLATVSLTLISWRIDSTGQRLDEVEARHVALRDENVGLLTQKAKLASREYVVQEAGRRLGLRPAEPGQVRRL
ncbi:MAG: hypothetical protein BWK76_06970 [Desulfobulbaceae bacterium A2]|nr:MAG: hypothetical protein BWK76_06970 [Desulfobulbaceae bacterium A2]